MKTLEEKIIEILDNHEVSIETKGFYGTEASILRLAKKGLI